MRSRPAHRKFAKIEIRPARAANLDALMELEQRVFATDRLSRRSMRRLLDSPRAHVLAAEVGGRLAGAAVMLTRARSRVARLYSIGVMPPLSGRGVAAALLAAIEKAAAARRCRNMRLEVHVTNAAAISLYRKSGYRQFGRHAAYYEDGGDALRFEKPLGVPPARGRRR